MRHLTEEYSPRESASDQELAAAHHLIERLSTMGHETSLQGFPVTVKRARVKLASGSRDIPDPPRALALTDSPFETATGRLRYVGRAYESDIPADGLNGQIALITRGDITFEEKVHRAARAGAVGAIIANNSRSRFYDWYAVNPPIPTVAVSLTDGQYLGDLAQDADLEATVTVGMQDLRSRNVIADIPSSISTDRTVIIGAHYDTLISAEGANDNASGVATVLTIAEHIWGHAYPFDVRVVLFGAEEDGLLGSNHYVDNMSPDEIDNTIAMLNFDGVGIGHGLLCVGDEHITIEAFEISRRNGFNMVRGVGEISHAPFQTAGIPAISLASFWNSSSPQTDDLQSINAWTLGQATRTGLYLIEWLSAETFALDSEPQPSPTPTSSPEPMTPTPIHTPLPRLERPTASSDRAALVAFYMSTAGDGWTNSEGWLSDAPLNEWHGVQTGLDGRVTELILDQNDLGGALPREIGFLSELTVLYHGGNFDLVGHIPLELGYLSKLKTLVLDDVWVTGAIPRELGQLSSLEILSLNNTQLTGPIPRELGNLTNLKELRILRTRLTGPIPREFGNLTSLVELNLSINRFTGGIPAELGNLPALKGLWLYDNRLTGEIPLELTGLSHLQSLSLSYNDLSGCIPPSSPGHRG